MCIILIASRNSDPFVDASANDSAPMFSFSKTRVDLYLSSGSLSQTVAFGNGRADSLGRRARHVAESAEGVFCLISDGCAYLGEKVFQSAGAAKGGGAVEVLRAQIP